MRWHEKLRTRLMVPIIGVLALSIAASLGWLYYQQHRAMLDRASEETELVGDVAKAGLRAEMLRETEDLTQQSIDVISARARLLDLSVLTKKGVVKYSSDPARIGDRLGPEHPTCNPCHGAGLRAGKETITVTAEDGTRTMRSMNLIENEAECQECHGESSDYLGMVVLDRGLDRELHRIGGVQRLLAGMGATTLAAVAAVILLIVQRLVQRPVDALIEGTRRIRERDFDTRVDPGCKGELGELAGAFNAMVADTRSYVREIENKTFELSTLYQIVDRVTRTIDLERLRQIILDIIDVAFADVEAAFIAIRPDQTDEIFIGTRSVSETMTSNVLVRAPELEGLPESIDAELVTRWLEGGLEGRRLSEDGSRADVPLRAGGYDIGLLSVTKASGKGFPETELHLLEALERHISVALENARLYSLAVTDELTRTYTLRYFQTTLQGEIARYDRYGQKSAVLMIDIDDFKRINDTHGHPAGDYVLRRLGRILRESVREVDIVCRYGGEEFAVVLPTADSGAAHTVAERIRAAIEGHRFEVAEGVETVVTVSVGLAVCPADATSVRQLVEAADAALYRAKRAGKNRVGAAGEA